MVRKKKGRYDLYGKYNLNLEEVAILKDFLKIDGTYIYFDDRKKEYIILNSKKIRITNITSRTFFNIPKDKEYEIQELLK